MSGAPVLAKFGGELVETPDRLAAVGRALAVLAAEGPLVVVHGGGREIDAELARRGVAKQAVDGLRITDAPTLGGMTHALGYSYSEDPNFMYCAEALGTEGADNWWLSQCGLSGGSSGGPWLQPVSAGAGPIVSVNSWGYTNQPGMAGPKLSGSSAGCLFDKAKTTSTTMTSTSVTPCSAARIAHLRAGVEQRRCHAASRGQASADGAMWRGLRARPGSSLRRRRDPAPSAGVDRVDRVRCGRGPRRRRYAERKQGGSPASRTTRPSRSSLWRCDRTDRRATGWSAGATSRYTRATMSATISAPALTAWRI